MDIASSAPASSRGPASFATQADALLRKNLTFQKRNKKTNACIVAYPFVLCVLLVIIQTIINNELDKPKNRCGCICIPSNSSSGGCQEVCGIQYSDLDQVGTCPIPSPPKWPALMQVPRPEYRAVSSDPVGNGSLPDASCKNSQSCPATVLFTGRNQSLAQSLAGNFFGTASSLNLSNFLNTLADVVPGTDAPSGSTEFIEPAFISNTPLYVLQPKCMAGFTNSLEIDVSDIKLQEEVRCVQGLPLWRDNTSVINDELFKGYRRGNTEEKINEFVAAYDFVNSNENAFSVNIWYNSTYNNYSAFTDAALVRVPRSLNLASNAFLKFLRGTGMMMQFEYVQEMPQPAKEIKLDFSSILGPLFFTWVIQLLFPVILTYVVYEKQHKLKIMMKMHGLKDGPYWIISYAYFFALSAVYMLCFVIFGSVIGLKFFTLNDYSIQFVFYFIYMNLQIVLAFLVSASFSDVKTATVVAYIYVYGTGLLGQYLLEFFVEDTSFPRAWIIVMEIVPGFSLYRGLYEFAQYAFTGNSTGTSGMRWGNINDSQNGMKGVLIIMTIEWLVLLPFAYYLHQVSSFGGGIIKSPLSFLRHFRKRKSASEKTPSLQRDASKVFVEMERPDVAQEREVVEKLILDSSCNTHAIISDNLKKIYPGKDGNPPKFAVKGLSLALPRGECFGMLGPNGAGKTSFISMMIGLISPSSGTAYVQGLDIRSKMDEIYSNMGVCPQHDLLWETLTGREHLMFYGRLKNLKGAALMEAVDESLKSVNLFYGGVGDKHAGQYSGGMKRRLSVAISLIGDPKVVYMDEPSTGLDPASRNNLWNVVKKAKVGRAIILTTHSMEEAEVLCDRLGIFVDGSLQCIGNPKELKARYGGSYIFTVTTSADEEEEVELLARGLATRANKIYHISGTQKFELPKEEVRIADVFKAVERAKSKLTIQAWGLVDTTLEDVFIRVAKSAQSSDALS